MIIFTHINKNFKKLKYPTQHKNTINLVNKYRNFISYMYCPYYEYKKFKDYFIKSLYEKILKYISYLNYADEWHREDGPAFIEYNKKGKINRKQYYINGKNIFL